MFSCLWWPAIDREGIIRPVHGAPVGELWFERGFNFPIFDQILHEGWETACFMAELLGFVGTRQYFI